MLTNPCYMCGAKTGEPCRHKPGIPFLKFRDGTKGHGQRGKHRRPNK